MEEKYKSNCTEFMHPEEERMFREYAQTGVTRGKILAALRLNGALADAIGQQPPPDMAEALLEAYALRIRQWVLDNEAPYIDPETPADFDELAAEYRDKIEKIFTALQEIDVYSEARRKQLFGLLKTFVLEVQKMTKDSPARDEVRAENILHHLYGAFQRSYPDRDHKRYLTWDDITEVLEMAITKQETGKWEK